VLPDITFLIAAYRACGPLGAVLMLLVVVMSAARLWVTYHLVKAAIEKSSPENVHKVVRAGSLFTRWFRR
jgi:hypothetical protein